MIRMAAGWELTMLFPCTSPPHTIIHPPHIGSTILGESVIVFQGLQTHFNNIVSLLMVSLNAHLIVYSAALFFQTA